MSPEDTAAIGLHNWSAMLQRGVRLRRGFEGCAFCTVK
jgi:hypothetical protein